VRRPHLRRVAVTGAALLALVLVPALPASAHAKLDSTDPPANANLKAAPTAVVLEFDEPVEVALGSVRVLDAKGRRVDRGRVQHPGGNPKIVRIELDSGLKGGFAVGWRVVSADAHPISGAFTFGVGAGTGRQASAVADELLAGGSGSYAVGVVFAVVRWLDFAALVLLVGAGVFLVVVWRAGTGNPRARRLLWSAWGTGLGGTVAAIGLQGAYATGLPLTSALDPALAGEILATRYGVVLAARIVLLLLAIPILIALGRTGLGKQEGRPAWFSAWAVDMAALAGVGLLLTPGLAGHAGTGAFIPIGIVADLVHLSGVSVWLGGLVMLVAVVLPRRDAAELRQVVPRFSSIAFGAVVAIVASGTVQAWRQLGSVSALTSTTYGRLLLVKVAVVAGLVGLGWASRRIVQRRLVPAGRLVARPAGPGAAKADPDGDIVSRLRRSVGVEVVLAAVVLAVTSLLVQAAPARSFASGGVTFGTVAPGAPSKAAFGATMRAGSTTVIATADPARTGANVLHFSLLDPNGQLADVPGFDAELRLEAQGLGPIKLPMTKLGSGHYVAYNVLIPIGGTWELRVTVRTSDIDEQVATTAMRVR
jgi:copper transport protein